MALGCDAFSQAMARLKGLTNEVVYVQIYALIRGMQLKGKSLAATGSWCRAVRGNGFRQVLHELMGAREGCRYFEINSSPLLLFNKPYAC